VTLEETINKLQSENEWEKQNQIIEFEFTASLEMRISQLQSENSSLLEKEAELVEKATQVALEETINKLKCDNELHTRKQVGLEMRIAQLESEKSSLLQKEVGLVEETKWLLSEKEILSLKVDWKFEKKSSDIYTPDNISDNAGSSGGNVPTSERDIDEEAPLITSSSRLSHIGRTQLTTIQQENEKKNKEKKKKSNIKFILEYPFGERS
ncbi:hypothetical protein S245_041130, partial [Arachis hypogaea]